MLIIFVNIKGGDSNEEIKNIANTLDFLCVMFYYVSIKYRLAMGNILAGKDLSAIVSL